ncbi:MAG: restriction endonuclease subunit S, partial [Campylobacter sp.]|uniref:restriction endonuclease subunit S n=1 Tax=Campylobacter sp. TaxID=205 RepID=UPI00297B67DD
KGFEISRQLPKNSILVTCIGATIGKTGLILKEGICNQQINAILPNEKFISKFLFFAITSEFFQNEIKHNASSTTLSILNKSKFSKLYIPLPPLDEQERIVKKIDELFEILEVIENSL